MSILWINDNLHGVIFGSALCKFVTFPWMFSNVYNGYCYMEKFLVLFYSIASNLAPLFSYIPGIVYSSLRTAL